MRPALVFLTLIGVSTTAAAQDMPLSQVLIDGEGWKPAFNVALSASPPGKVPGIENPTCQVKSPDGGTLFVGTTTGKYVWAFRIEQDGSLTAGQPYCSLFARRGEKDMPVSGLAVDRDGRIYAATPAGVQIFDPTGRLCGVLLKPSDEPLTAVSLSDGQLVVATKSMNYVRKVKTKGVAAK